MICLFWFLFGLCVGCLGLIAFASWKLWHD